MAAKQMSMAQTPVLRRLSFLDRYLSIRAGRPHGRAETAAHSFCSSDDEKGPAAKDRAGA